MAGVVGKLHSRGLFHLQNAFRNRKETITTFRNIPRNKKIVLVASGLAATGASALVYCLDQSVKATDGVHPPHYPWSHMDNIFSSLDHASIRRGYEVYKQVCAACHSLPYFCFRELIGVSHTEEEARAEAEEVLIEDGPDDEGKMFMRKGKLGDPFPAPYPNPEAARAANNGAHPPDLTYMTFARHGGEDYVFSLLTGYCDPPANVVVPPNQHYNPYFPGGTTSMARALYNEVIEYSDGTPATASQMAKDITIFLRWAGEPYHDERKEMLVKWLPLSATLLFVAWFMFRKKWINMKTRVIALKPK